MPSGLANEASWRGRAEVIAVTADRPVHLRPGAVVHVGATASVQFAGASAFQFRIIRIDDIPTYDGWAWLEGYQLGPNGEAVARRRIFVQMAGLRPGRPSTPPGAR